MKDHLKLLAEHVQYRGPTSLLDLDVKNVSIHSEGPDHVYVKMHLRRRCMFHIATTYFPTLCLFMISEVLLYIGEDHFEATIMVSLTAMLVMYTLHQSILAHLPKTSYMKMIDIWLLSGHTIPFLVFVLTVISELIRHNKNENKKKRAKRVNNGIPTKLKNTYYEKKNLKTHQPFVSSCPMGHSNFVDEKTNEFIIEEPTTTNALRVSRGTQSDKKYSDQAQKYSSTLTNTKDESENKFAVIEDILMTCKKVTIPLMTVTFITLYVIVAVRNYVLY